jgi:hypothetical protein
LLALVKRLMDGSVTLRYKELQPPTVHFRYRRASVQNNYRKYYHLRTASNWKDQEAKYPFHICNLLSFLTRFSSKCWSSCLKIHPYVNRIYMYTWSRMYVCIIEGKGWHFGLGIYMLQWTFAHTDIFASTIKTNKFLSNELTIFPLHGSKAYIGKVGMIDEFKLRGKAAVAYFNNYPRKGTNQISWSLDVDSRTQLLRKSVNSHEVQSNQQSAPAYKTYSFHKILVTLWYSIRIPTEFFSPWTRIREWIYSLRILDIRNSRKWMFNFTLRSLYPRGMCPRYPLYRRLGGSRDRSGQRGEEKNFATTRNRTPTPRPSSS